jgi:hypothetical protein
MDLEPGRIGFMNTQRREDRWQRTSCTHGAGASRHLSSGPIMLHGSAQAKVGTAPPAAPAWFRPSDGDLSPGAPARLATNSLQSDYRSLQLVRIVQFVQLARFLSRLAVQSAVQEKHEKRHNARHSPPYGASVSAATGTLTAPGSSHSFIPSPSGLDRLHPTLPQFPAGERRWTERYDGKGNLHLLHAA